MIPGFARSFCCTLLLVTSQCWAEDPTDPEIACLLSFVADSSCVFIRNGDEHSSADAADHLRLKYDRGRRYAGTAAAFIDNLATQSSWSGKAYTVRCGDDTETSNAWLHRALVDCQADGNGSGD